MQVNGVNLENVSHDKAVMVLKSTQERVTMMIGRMVSEQGQPPSCSVPPQMMTHNQAAEVKSTANMNMGRINIKDILLIYCYHGILLLGVTYGSYLL